MPYKQSYIVDEAMYYKDFVLVVDGKIQYYTLQDGEKLIDISPSGLIKPRWNGSEWEEGASEEEIAATLPSLEVLKTAKTAEIRAISAAKVAAIQAGYTLGEINTFEQQYAGACEIIAHGVADNITTMSKDAQFVIGLARGRSAVGGIEVTPEGLSQTIVTNYSAAKDYTITILSLQQGLETKARVAASREELKAIQWPESI